MYIIEYRNWDSQSVIGTGVTQITDDGLTNMAIPTGLTAGYGANSTNCGNFTCSVTTVHYQTHQITNQISYRGLEGWYGNTWKWTDFINIQADNKPWVADHSPQSDVFSGAYTFSGVTLSAADGYGSNIAYAAGYDYGFLPSAVAGSSSTYLTDYYYQAAGNRSALVGGDWSDGANAGFASWGLANAASSVHRAIGARVAFTPPLYANFTYNNATKNVAFTDTSYNISTKTGVTTSPFSWNWSFGDGTTSTLRNPQHFYTFNGNHNVVLNVSDGINYAVFSNMIISSINISSSFLPYLAVTTYPGSGITFTDTSTGSPTHWQWSFGDGTLSTLQNPTHSWTTAGTYTVSLNVTDGFDYSTNSTSVIVDSVNFTATPTTGKTPLTVAFTDLSGNATSWAWNFGDGGSSTTQNPTHTYLKPGSFQVTLNVVNAASMHGNVTKGFIVVSAAPYTQSNGTMSTSYALSLIISALTIIGLGLIVAGAWIVIGPFKNAMGRGGYAAESGIGNTSTGVLIIATGASLLLISYVILAPLANIVGA
jgi:PKD repeat protein